MKEVTTRIYNYIFFDISHLSKEIISIYIRFLKNKLQSIFFHRTDFSSEIFFWERQYNQFFISGKYPRNWNAYLSKNSKEMTQIIDILLKTFDHNLKFIDVGSGPITSFFDKIDIMKWNIVTVDPLAKIYNSLNERYPVIYPLNCIEGTGETLDKIYEKDSFHVVLCENAIDHATSPHTFIENLFYILKPGGFLFLSGYINEGSAANWIGLHQHDLSISEDHILWTNRDHSMENFNITKNLKMTLFYKRVEGTSPGDEFTLIYQKA
jgi:SAM-dependent methyltransferase